jgi:serine/threonine-protein kinase
MTPERWRRIDTLFDAALRLDPAVRGAWLGLVCGADDELRAEVARLLAQDERAARDGFLTPPVVTSRPFEPTLTFFPADDRGPPAGPGSIDRAGAGPLDATSGFTPKVAIAAGKGPHPAAEARSSVQVRLRGLALIYIGMFAMTIFWREVILGHRHPDLAVLTLNVLVIATLGGIAALLSGPRLFPPARLEALELGMIGMLAGMVAFTQYRLMLADSFRDDTMMAQLVMKNVVLLNCVLILTYGLYVPKSWRRAALVAGPLALLPFATLSVLCLRHPEAMGWLWRGWRKSETARIWLFGFDAVILLILAVASAYGARTISRLRRQVAEARQLGQYHLKQRIGSGGMGEVYLAEHQLLKRPCALKLIRPEDVADPKALERFEREVQITATLSHPNTVEIFDYGRTEDGTYYYVMEYLPGLSLAELVERHGPLPPARAVYLLRQVCQALREAHAAGLIHRDVKPSNIFAARRGGMDDVAKLLDFGLVRHAATARAAHLSGEGTVIGTPLFMSPEQATGDQELGERSDIYSLGAVAYYLLTGRPPFDVRDGFAVMIAHARDPVVPPSEVRDGVPEDLERVVLRCLAKDPGDRFSDAAGLERALAGCACVGDWDQERASRWWLDAGRAPAMSAIVI